MERLTEALIVESAGLAGGDKYGPQRWRQKKTKNQKTKHQSCHFDFKEISEGEPLKKTSLARTERFSFFILANARDRMHDDK